MGAKAEVIGSSLPFGVGSFSNVTEVAIPIGEQDYEEDVEERPHRQNVAKQSEEEHQNNRLQMMKQSMKIQILIVFRFQRKQNLISKIFHRKKSQKRLDQILMK